MSRCTGAPDGGWGTLVKRLMPPCFPYCVAPSEASRMIIGSVVAICREGPAN